MFEVERQAYLKSLGIVQYVPRQPIAGAMASPVLSPEEIYPPLPEPADVPVTQAPVETETAAVTEPEEAVQPQPLPTEAPSSAGLKVEIPKELLADKAAAQPVAKAPELVDTNTVEFCFCLLQTNSGIAVLAELGDAGVKDMSAQEHRLMNDLLVALNIKLEHCRHHYFKWPLVNNPRIKQGWPEAQETLSGFLEGKLSQQPVGTLLLLGEMPEKALPINNHQLVIAGMQLVTIHSPSLQAMLHNWQAKAKAWRLMAPLRGRAV